ncbi:MAG TPA: nicotinate-nucleotide--dimethylbenzimidazole phosphoribosyltransferase [Micropruina sp.]|nr:nicotinate-nucleotide--dimethylbenzimidazole phosphoribosyltransferase [Micropruina sp.]
MNLGDTVRGIGAVDERAHTEAVALQLALAKPPHALGRLEDLGVQLAAIAGVCPPPLPEPARIIVVAGDHGVIGQGVSRWPAALSGVLAGTIVDGVAGVSVLARSVGVQVRVLDAGLAAAVPSVPAAVIRRGTGDFTLGAAMTRDETEAALELGIREAELAADEGVRCLATGEVGIGNTTTAAALVAAFTGAEASTVAGRGADSPPGMVAHKAEVIARALELHRPDTADPVGVLAAVGGVEQAVLAGLVLGAARRRLPILLDGVTGVAAGLAAVALCPAAGGYLIAAHAGAEPGIAVGLHRLGLTPVLDLGMALGEGTGAALAIPILRAAVAVMTEMATLESLLG